MGKFDVYYTQISKFDVRLNNLIGADTRGVLRVSGSPSFPPKVTEETIIKLLASRGLQPPELLLTLGDTRTPSPSLGISGGGPCISKFRHYRSFASCPTAKVKLKESPPETDPAVKQQNVAVDMI